VMTAAAARDAKVADSTGRAARFAATAGTVAPQREAQAARFYLEMMEELLPRQQLYVVDNRVKAPHQLYLINERLKALLGQAGQPAPPPAPERPAIAEE